MIGRFLEISVFAPQIQESLEFYQRLGFVQAETSDIWSHRYAVVTDGRLFLGLHDYEFPSPSLTFVRPQLEDDLELIRQYGIRFEFEKIGDEQFNEVGFSDPDGQMVTLLEARTFSPPAMEDCNESCCGRFSEYIVPSRNIEAAVAFWEPLGFVTTQQKNKPHSSATLTSNRINLGFSQSPALDAPALVFVEPDMAERIEKPALQGLVSAYNPAGDVAVLVSPEGLALHLVTGDY